MKKAKLNSAAICTYANENKICEAPEKMKDEELIDTVEKFVGDQDFLCQSETGGCDHFIRSEDTYCWFCGSDVTEDGTGGFEKHKNPPKEEVKEEKVKIDKSKIVKMNKMMVRDGCTLDDRVQRIKAMSGTAVKSAWQIGKELYEIQEGQIFKDGGYNSFEAFCNDKLGWSRINAYYYIRVAQNYTEEDAIKLGLAKLNLIMKAPEKARPKLLKMAMPEEDGGKALSVSELQTKIDEARGRVMNEEKQPRSPFTRFIGTTIKARHDKKKDCFTFLLDDCVVVVVNGNCDVEFLAAEK